MNKKFLKILIPLLAGILLFVFIVFFLQKITITPPKTPKQPSFNFPTSSPTNSLFSSLTSSPNSSPTSSLPPSSTSAIPVYVFLEPPKTLGKIKKYHIEHDEIFNRDYIIVPHDGIKTQNIYMPFDGLVFYYDIDGFNISLQIYSGMKNNDVVISLVGPFVPQKILKEDTTVEVKKGTLIAKIDKSKALHETILFDAMGLYKGDIPADINILYTYLPEMFK